MCSKKTNEEIRELIKRVKELEQKLEDVRSGKEWRDKNGKASLERDEKNQRI